MIDTESIDQATHPVPAGGSPSMNSRASFSEYVEEIHPDVQGVAFGFNHFVTRLFILGSVLLAPPMVAATDWQAWMMVTLLATVLFALIVTRVHGNMWRRDGLAAESSQPTQG